MEKATSTEGFYRLPQALIDEIDLIRLEVERFQRDEITPEQFKQFRVPRGIYSQRGGQTYMMRVKVPAGGLTPLQMETFADLSARYGNGIVHATDRQDVQLHGVYVENIPTVVKGLAAVHLTTRGGGGNTIRNITACPDSGVCPREAFAVAPYAIALSERLMTDPRSGVLPRKFKTAFSGCPHDCALATVNDLGFIAKQHRVNGRLKVGFTVYVGGGMGAHSRIADRLEEFIPADDVYPVAEAIIRLFDRYGDRNNRNKARLRFVVERFGFEKFRILYQEELAKIRNENLPALDLRPIPGREEITSLEPLTDLDNPALQNWLATNVHAQKQAGYYYVEMPLLLGNSPAAQFRQLAGIVSRFGERTVRVTQRQNILLRWLRTEELESLYQALTEIGLAQSGAGGVTDIVSCPGAATCNLGICLSRSLALEITRVIQSNGLPQADLSDVDIKVSGCPNACGHHPIGAIGLHGAAHRINGRLVPHYRIFLGGRVREGQTALGTLLGLIPARRVPQLIRDVLAHYLKGRKAGEGFHDFLNRRGRADLDALLSNYTGVPAYADDPTYYRDWGASNDFSLVGLGPGECGAGVRDVMTADIEDARRYVYRAAQEMNKEQNGQFLDDLYQALLLATRALLVARQQQPASDRETWRAFRHAFVDTGLLSNRYADLEERAGGLRKPGLSTTERAAALDYVRDLVEQIRSLYERMDVSFQFR